MRQPFRLPAGGTIDRTRILSFRFNGRAYYGYAGDTLASALLANGIRLVSRSFKYHRPRGIYSAGEEEPNALLEIGEEVQLEPNCRAPQVILTEGLIARTQNVWPALRLDLARILDYTHALWPAGFYNKTFKWPSWHAWEAMIRRMSGLGSPSLEPDPDHYEHVNAYCDLLICGGGPAGLMAALVAGRAGLRVILADQDIQFGGALNWERVQLDGQPADKWIAEVVSELATLPSVTLLPRTTAAGTYDDNVTTLLQRGEGGSWRECFWTVRPKRILLATGAIEQGAVFANNDRPGIMLASAVRHYLNRYAVAAGKRVVIATNNDSAYQTVIDLCHRGVRVLAAVDSRKDIRHDISGLLDSLGVALYREAKIRNTRGARGIRALSIETLAGKLLRRVNCDLLGISGGWAARLHLLCHARGTVKFNTTGQSFLPDRLPHGFHVLGSAAGIADLSEILADAVDATTRVCEDLGLKVFHVHQPLVTQTAIASRQVGTAVLRPARGRQWIDLAHDVTFADAALAVREGYDSVEHFKRYTTAGMSVDQGKTGNLNALLALSALTGKSVDEIGTTTFRPPYAPVTLGAIAGRGLGDFYSPRRYLPAHRIHQMLGAHFEDYGGWQRPEFYPLKGESRAAAIRRETLAVRENVAVFDNSPIGKIEVRGPHAAEFLNRIYINNVRGLAVGRTRYGLMLNENGVVIDDGVFSRLADDHFLVNTTSGGTNRVLAMFEEWLQCEWTALRVLVDDVTTQWANFTIAGPRARGVLQKLGTNIDLSPQALPHMAVATGVLAGETARIIRVSFSGEISYEVNLPANRATSFLARLMKLRDEIGLTPYGIETLMVLRLEKGYFHVGSDTNGETTPDDVGWGQVARNKPTDFIGRRSLFRPANLRPDRKQLVGLVALDTHQTIHAGGHLLIGENRCAPEATDGWITSAAHSPTLGRHIALAMLRAGGNHKGQVLTVIDGDEQYQVRVVSTPFFDMQNERLKK